MAVAGDLRRGTGLAVDGGTGTVPVELGVQATSFRRCRVAHRHPGAAPPRRRRRRWHDRPAVAASPAGRTAPAALAPPPAGRDAARADARAPAARGAPGLAGPEHRRGAGQLPRARRRHRRAVADARPTTCQALRGLWEHDPFEPVRDDHRAACSCSPADDGPDAAATADEGGRGGSARPGDACPAGRGALVPAGRPRRPRAAPRRGGDGAARRG